MQAEEQHDERDHRVPRYGDAVNAYKHRCGRRADSSVNARRIGWIRENQPENPAIAGGRVRTHLLVADRGPYLGLQLGRHVL